ncbi:hypothetical protein M23134_07609 [Microscilla marina ATCC 23134]|uniref:Uncharacterized protein n=1 Tax=Microscilla marina ATCC 23134 TaxID=313606 RepID=A1ZF95_MICM2|nr:hypothetical protein M23134_07609 [Microscilla marina ATCC 23134]
MSFYNFALLLIKEVYLVSLPLSNREYFIQNNKKKCGCVEYVAFL